METAKTIIKQLPENEANLISNEITAYLLFDDSDLPKDIIHVDLFKDNALFEGNTLSGIIDFYDACYDTYLYDFAITVNAWCADDNGELIEEYVNAFLQCYQAIRPLSVTENEAWPIMLRISAMRFWLSRLKYSLNQPTGDLTQLKNPKDYQRILKNLIASANQ